jgi:hypothetical protein
LRSHGGVSYSDALLLNRRRRRERAGAADGPMVDSQRLARDDGGSAFCVKFPLAVESHLRPQRPVLQEAHNCVSKRSFVAWGYEGSGSAIVDDFREPSDRRRDNWLHERIRERDHATLRGLDVRKDDETRLPKQLAASLLRHILVVDDKPLWMGHETPVAAEILAFTGNHDSRAGHP